MIAAQLDKFGDKPEGWVVVRNLEEAQAIAQQRDLVDFATELGKLRGILDQFSVLPSGRYAFASGHRILVFTAGGPHG